MKSRRPWFLVCLIYDIRKGAGAKCDRHKMMVRACDAKAVATHPLLFTNYASSIFPPFLTPIPLKDGNIIYGWALTTEQRLIENVNCSLFNSFLLAFAIQVIGWNFFLIFIVRKLFTVTWCFPFAVVISVGLLFDVGINIFWKKVRKLIFTY